MENKNEKDFSIFRVLSWVFFFVSLYFVVGSFLGSGSSDMDSVRYATLQKEGMATVEILDVFREKGKETLYKIRISYDDAGFSDTFQEVDTVTIPESVYLKHIGEGNNAFTVCLESLYVFKGEEYLSLFGDSEAGFDVEKGYGTEGKVVHRILLPWEEAEHFTDEDVREVAEWVLQAEYGELEDLSEEALDVKLKKVPEEKEN